MITDGNRGEVSSYKLHKGTFLLPIKSKIFRGSFYIMKSLILLRGCGDENETGLCAGVRAHALQTCVG